MINYFIWIYTFAFVWLEYFVGLKACFNVKYAINKIAYAICIALLLVFSYIIKEDEPIYLIMHIAMFFLMFFSTGEKLSKRITYSVYMLFLVLAMNNLCRLPYANIRITGEPAIDDRVITSLQMLTVVLIFMLIIVISRKRKNEDVIEYFEPGLVIMVGVLAFTFIAFAGLVGLSIKYVGEIYDIYGPIAKGCMYICYFAICIFALFVIKIRQSNYNLKTQKQKEKLFFEEQNFYLRKLLEKEADTRKFRHEINNYMIFIKDAVENKQYDELEKSISKMINENKEIATKVYDVGNNQISSSLNYVFSDTKDIEISVNGKVSKELDALPVDVSLVISNVLKNAVESVSKLKEGKKYIEVNLKSAVAYTIITVKNPYSEDIIINKNGLPFTSKEDKKNHGFGLERVKNIMASNHGRFEINTNNNIFEVVIGFRNAKEQM